jgi:hypothetical protein
MVIIALIYRENCMISMLHFDSHVEFFEHSGNTWMHFLNPDTKFDFKTPEIDSLLVSYLLFQVRC